MTSKWWTPSRTIIGVVTALLLIAGTAAAWSFRSVNHLSSGTADNTFVMDCDFDKFRQIMVRKNATAAIIGRSGMTLIDEQLHDVGLDTSNDDRPLLNAIRGQSKSEVDATKEITVRLDDPALEADQLVLRQHASIRPDSMNVQTQSKASAGNLKDYRTTLRAIPSDGGTKVTLSVAMKVQVKVPKLFASRAEAKVQQAAEDAVSEQAESIKSFVARHADKRLILPELGG